MMQYRIHCNDFGLCTATDAHDCTRWLAAKSQLPVPAKFIHETCPQSTGESTYENTGIRVARAVDNRPFVDKRQLKNR
jgi:hypothetical protein